MEEAIVRIQGLTKRYGQVLAVDHLDLEIAPGEVFGLLGPNGAGKTTTTLMLLGTYRAGQRHRRHRRTGLHPSASAGQAGGGLSPGQRGILSRFDRAGKPALFRGRSTACRWRSANGGRRRCWSGWG